MYLKGYEPERRTIDILLIWTTFGRRTEVINRSLGVKTDELLAFQDTPISFLKLIMTICSSCQGDRIVNSLPQRSALGVVALSIANVACSDIERAVGVIFFITRDAWVWKAEICRVCKSTCGINSGVLTSLNGSKTP